eukprot:GHVU01067537.1.p1 GENE.GHVU01067537.1~~GHVU01067537.1.p1  ORF type:complete len:130 (+),score=26.98 GHVU01067537.1:36-425(+)
MRLLTHNILMCNRKQCQGGFPLRIERAGEEGGGEASVRRVDVEFNSQFIKSVLSRLEWDAFRQSAEELGVSLPPTFSQQDADDDLFLRQVHEAALTIELIEGKLVCPSCGREFPVSKGIPNMLLCEDEV